MTSGAQATGEADAVVATATAGESSPFPRFWPVGWAVLSTFNERRGVIEAFDPPDRGGGNVFPAVAGMYLLIPAIAFLVVHLAEAAAALPFAPAVPPAAGAGLGPAGPMINVAARVAK